MSNYNGVKRIRSAYSTNFSEISKAVRARDNNKCTRCKCSSSIGNKLRAHHLISKSRGGPDNMFNLITLCDRCHAKQHNHGHLK